MSTSAPDRSARREDLYDRIEREGVNGYYTDYLPHVRYLTGFVGTAASLLLVGGEASSRLFLDGRYRHYGKELEASDLSVVPVREGRVEAVARVADELDLDRLHFERRRLSYTDFRAIVDGLDGADRTYGADWVGEHRLRKDDYALDRIRGAIEATLELFDLIEEWLEPGIDERTLARAIRRELESRGDGLAFDPLVLGGPHTAHPHRPSTDRSLEAGDLLLVDMGLTRDGYCSDLTRMFRCGDGTADGDELYDLSKRAAAAAFEVLEPGRSLAEVDRAGHDVIRDAGYGDHIRHGLGHGVGLEVHEGPSLSEKADGSLKSGMVVTLEPGIYIHGNRGGRIEHMAQITERGARLLDRPDDHLQKVLSRRGFDE